MEKFDTFCIKFFFYIFLERGMEMEECQTISTDNALPVIPHTFKY